MRLQDLSTDRHGNVWHLDPRTGVQSLVEAASDEALTAACADIRDALAARQPVLQMREA